MAGYSVRSLVDLSQAARKYFTQSIDGAIASVWANTFTVMAKVLALVGQGLELRRAWLVRQLFASTAERVWLIRHGFELGLQPDPAGAAFGTATAAAPSGTLVPAGLQYARGDGVVYSVQAAASATGNSVSLTIEADDAGAAGNCEPGTVLTLVSPADAPDGLATTCTVDPASDGTGLTGGADEEALEAFRARVLFRKRNPPMGGAGADYAQWIRAAVAGAVPYVDSYSNDSRAVWIRFTVLNLPAGVDPRNGAAVLAAYCADTSIVIPTVGQIAEAVAYIRATDANGNSLRRPVTARFFIDPPERKPVAITIADLRPATADVMQAIELEIAATFLDRAQPGRPTQPGQPSGDFVFSASWINEAISRATGEDRHRLVLDDVVCGPGELATLGSITYA